MAYRVEIRRGAHKQLNRIHAQYRQKIMESVSTLSEDPRPQGSRKLRGREGYRLRVGDYRILYRVSDEAREVLIAEVWNRRRGYR